MVFMLLVYLRQQIPQSDEIIPFSLEFLSKKSSGFTKMN